MRLRTPRASGARLTLPRVEARLPGRLVDNFKIHTSGAIPMAYKFVIKKDKKDEFRVNFVASNGETMFATEGYASKASAKNAIESFKKNGPAAEIDDQTD